MDNKIKGVSEKLLNTRRREIAKIKNERDRNRLYNSTELSMFNTKRKIKPEEKEILCILIPFLFAGTLLFIMIIFKLLKQIVWH